jgi:trans-aconitate 2-methyltransferase
MPYVSNMSYTFGDNHEASRRLGHLAEVYELETRSLLTSAGAVAGVRFELAVDLGCGPGWSTQLIEIALNPVRTVGLDASERFIAEARSNHPRLEFIRHDVIISPFPVQNPDLLFCRFLLTHFPSPRAALQCWARVSRPNAILAMLETESLYSEYPTLSRYYEMVGLMQSHYGQKLNIGASLDAVLDGTEWTAVESESVLLEKSACEMAQLHLANIRTWGKSDFAIRAFDRGEVHQVEQDLALIASGAETAGVVHNTVKRVIARRKAECAGCEEA